MVMSMFFLFISLLFPFLVYFIYLVYSDLKNNEEKNYILDLVLVTGFYLPIVQGYLLFENILLINIPLFISIIKKRTSCAVLLIFLLIMLNHFFIPNINIIWLLLEYLSIFILLNIVKKYEITIFLSIKLFFIIFYEMILKLNVITINLSTFVLMFILTYLIFVVFKYIYFKLESIVSLRVFAAKSIKEKKQYQNLFKITHEVKNPLAVCKGYLQMINLNEKEKSKKFIDIINDQIDKTLEIIKDFSNISNLKINRHSVSLNLLLDEMQQDISVFKTSNVKIVMNVPNDKIIVLADNNRMKQVLLNVIKNAKESIEGKGIIKIDLYKKKNYAYIKVSDNGVGMDYKTLNNLFTPFFTTKQNGTGLGVCLSKEIIEKHDGSIEYFSKENKGTKVIIKLPLEKASV